MKTKKPAVVAAGNTKNYCFRAQDSRWDNDSSFDRDALPDPYNYYLDELGRLIGNGEWRAATCPFHDDHDPSLRVNVVTGAFKCFPCGASGGDVLAFHMQNHDLGFIDAARAMGCWRGGGR
jgi:hypothetical protein